MRFAATLLLVSALISGCAALGDRKIARAVEGKRWDEAISLLEERTARAPGDGEAFRDLGLVYLDAGRPDRAMPRLQTAARLLPEDRSLPLLIGLCREARSEWAGAIEAYRSYKSAGRPPAVGRAVRGRMARLVRKVYDDRAALLVREPAPLSPGLLVVRYFDVLAEAETYGNLGKGIAEQLIGDFSRIKDFPVVARLSFEALRQEVDRSRAAGRDPLAVASLDARLGAGWSLGGTILPREEAGEIRIDYFLVNNVTGEVTPPSSLSGSLGDLFALEKRVVASVAEKLGAAITDDERRAIAPIPTTHFRAFLAYCDALDAEDRGDHASARSFYAQALRLDPRFALAAERAERTTGDPGAIRSIALAEIALPGEIRLERRVARAATMLLPSPVPERGEASDLSNVRPSGEAELLIRVDRP